MILFVFSFMISYTPITGVALNELDSLDGEISQGQLPISDDGFLKKTNSNIIEGINSLDSGFYYIVKKGDSLYSISKDFSISVETLKLCNPSINFNNLVEGTEIFVPPVDGILYKIKKDDNLDKLASLYNISKDSLLFYNNDILYKKEGDMIFLPHVRGIILDNQEEKKKNNNEKSNKKNIVNNVKDNNKNNKKEYIKNNKVNNLIISSEGSMMMPTTGIITQRYRRGHYAIDIAQRGGATVFAAKSGVVKEVSVGSWNYGYGNYIIIDHGGGITTLYAHLARVYVSPGQTVSKGTAIGYMGSTGRSSGTHLHFEVILNGRKQNPFAYIR